MGIYIYARAYVSLVDDVGFGDPQVGLAKPDERLPGLGKGRYQFLQR